MTRFWYVPATARASSPVAVRTSEAVTGSGVRGTGPSRPLRLSCLLLSHEPERGHPSGRHRKTRCKGAWARGDTCHPLGILTPVPSSGTSRTGGAGAGGAGSFPLGPEVTCSASSHSPRGFGRRRSTSPRGRRRWPDPAALEPLPHRSRPGLGRGAGARPPGRCVGAGSRGLRVVRLLRPPRRPPTWGWLQLPRLLPQSGGQLQGTDKARGPSARLLCFGNLFSNGKRLRAVVRRYLRSSPLGEDVLLETHGSCSQDGATSGSERGAGPAPVQRLRIFSYNFIAEKGR